LNGDEVMRGASLVAESLLAPVTKENVVHAEGRFAQRRHQATSKWKPTDAQLQLLVAAL